MKFKKIISSLIVVAIIIASTITAHAEKVTVTTDVYLSDDICGYLNIMPVTETDIYVKIYKHTLETDKSGYLVYDSIIRADQVHVGDTYIFPLEYNDYNIETKNYDGSYDIMIGVQKFSTSSNPDSIVYKKINLTVEDINYSGAETLCYVNIALTNENLNSPSCEENGTKFNKTYNMTFSHLSFMSGDANSDNIINVRDCAYIATMLAQGQADKLDLSADFNNDGAVNVRDAANIASSLAGLNSQPSTETTQPSTESVSETTQTTVTTSTTTSSATVTSSVSATTTATSSSGEITAALTDPTEPSVSETTAASATDTTTSFSETTNISAVQTSQTTITTPMIIITGSVTIK